MTTVPKFARPRFARRERRWATPSPLAVGLAVTGVAGIAFATLCPIGMRPHIANANVERFAAYLALGVLVSRAAGRRALTATLAIMALAFGLEAAQRLAPGRHAQLADAVIKAFGGVSGVAGYQLIFPIRRMLAGLSGSSGGGGTPVRVPVPARVPASQASKSRPTSP